MEINVSDLTGMALDWAVGMAVGKQLVIRSPIGQPGGPRVVWEQVGGHGGVVWFAPSGNWAHGGPLLEYRTWALPYKSINRCHMDKFEARTPGGIPHNGDTPLIAACRAIVAAELGVVVDVPDELL